MKIKREAHTGRWASRGAPNKGRTAKVVVLSPKKGPTSVSLSAIKRAVRSSYARQKEK